MELSNAWIFASFILIFYQKGADAVDCYVCSWSPRDKEVESDRCSTGNFDERRVRQIDCRIGCEIVKILDSNGDLLMFYRNCLMSSPNKFDYERSNKKTTIMTEEEFYACDSDLCNRSVATTSSLLATALVATMPFVGGPF